MAIGALSELAKKARGAFFVVDEEAPRDDEEIDIDAFLAEKTGKGETSKTKTAEQVVAEAPGPNLNEINVPADAVVVENAGTDTPMDFNVIYQAAKIQQLPFGAENFLGMLGALPATMPQDMKRQTVMVSLNALGSTTGTNAEGIMADATQKITALSTYRDNLETATQKRNEESSQEIAKLEAEIEAKRKSIMQNSAYLDNVNRQCQAEAERLDDVIEFFSAGQPTPPAPLSTDPDINKLKQITGGN